MLRYFNLWLGIGWIMVFLLSYFSLVPNPPEFNVELKHFDKVRHFIAYFILMFWFSQLYKTSNARLFYVVFFTLLGVVLEILQGLCGVRYFEYNDMLANTLGIMVAWVITRGHLNSVLLFFENKLFK